MCTGVWAGGYGLGLGGMGWGMCTVVWAGVWASLGYEGDAWLSLLPVLLSSPKTANPGPIFVSYIFIVRPESERLLCRGQGRSLHLCSADLPVRSGCSSGCTAQNPYQLIVCHVS